LEHAPSLYTIFLWLAHILYQFWLVKHTFRLFSLPKVPLG
jgi:hypothetical protein